MERRGSVSFVRFIAILIPLFWVSAKLFSAKPEFTAYAAPQVPAHPPDGHCSRSLDDLFAELKGDYRWAAAECLGESRDSRAIKPLVHAIFVEPIPRYVMIEREALRKIGDPQMADLFVEGLKSPRTRYVSASSLGYLQLTRGLEPLVAMLKFDDEFDRQIAASALGAMKDTRAVGPLCEALTQENEVLRSYVATSLGEIGDPAAVPSLITALDDSDDTVRTDAETSLGEIKDPRAVDGLIARLNDSKELDGVRAAAADALANIGDSRAIDPIVKAMNSGLEWNSAAALAVMKDSRAAQVLVDALQHGNTRIVAPAYLFFIRRGDPASIPALSEALREHGDWEMARDFRDCGNLELANLGLQWLLNADFDDADPREEGSIIWGSDK